MPRKENRRRGRTGGGNDDLSFGKREPPRHTRIPRRGPQVNRRRELADQFAREAGAVSHLDIVALDDPAWWPSVCAWAAGATLDDPAHCLFPGCAARFGPGQAGRPRFVAFVRALGGTVAMAGGICVACSGRSDLGRAALAAFGVTGEVRPIDRAALSATEGRA